MEKASYYLKLADFIINDFFYKIKIKKFKQNQILQIKNHYCDIVCSSL